MTGPSDGFRRGRESVAWASSGSRPRRLRDHQAWTSPVKPHRMLRSGMKLDGYRWCCPANWTSSSVVQSRRLKTGVERSKRTQRVPRHPGLNTRACATEQINDGVIAHGRERNRRRARAITDKQQNTARCLSGKNQPFTVKKVLMLMTLPLPFLAGGTMRIRAPGNSRSWPSVTTVSPGRFRSAPQSCGCPRSGLL